MSLCFYRRFAMVSGFLAVSLGAFAAHGLKSHLTDYQADIWQAAVFYQFIHTLLLAFVSCHNKLNDVAHTAVNRICALLTLGLILFSGSLYLLALTGMSKLGMITPIGGTLFLLSWAYLAVIVKKLD